MTEKKMELLSHYRVLDLTDEKGYLCGKILGDLGADVIKIEIPGGDPSRNIGPFYHDIPDSEKSLSWFAFNSNKRGITLDIEKSDGRTIFLRLVEKADLVIESFPPGYMDNIGLGYSTLSEIKPDIIMTSITPFGQAGPYADFKASDIVLMAMSGVMYLWGDPDRAPVRLSVDQAYYHASADAATGSLIALYHREVSGEGQHIDVSTQESVKVATIESAPLYDMIGLIRKRTGSVSVSISKEDIITRHTWPCKDGYITFEVLGGKIGASFNRAIVNWASDEGMVDEKLVKMDWEEFDYLAATQEEHNHISEFIGTFFLTHTKEELFRGAVERRIILFPVTDTRDIAEDEQLKARNYWESVDHPELNTSIPYFGRFVKIPGSSRAIRLRSPLVGEHNREIYGKELLLSDEELIALKQARVI
ncbi:MAG: CoA transferase [Deltaproteobacteria bacterium]|nr:CoA transferase [Deltaproteobacteria bacterium]